MTKTLIIPGLDGSDAPHWQHWWATSDPQALMVDLPAPSRPVPDHWEIELAGAVLRHPDSILVGHSLGAVLIVRLLARWPQLRIRAALLVAPAETMGSDRIGQFGPIPERPLGIPAIVVASRDDPWMDFSRAARLASAWGAALVDLGAAGHINTAAGYGPWAQGKQLRDDLQARTTDQTLPHPALRATTHQPPTKRRSDHA